MINSSGKDLCAEVMSVPLFGNTNLSPVKVRLSRVTN